MRRRGRAGYREDARKEAPVPAMLIRHTVADYDVWKQVFDEHGPTRRANGSRGGRLFHSVDDPNEVVILLEWDDLERARLFADSDDLRETMTRAGVTDRPDIWFLTEGDRPSA
jgi:heme-degrading monooxygenase HmoA